MDDGYVWYVAYGSNLSRRRLQRYLDRCAPVAPPLDAVATDVPHRLFFAHESRFWAGGGTAFVDPARDPAAATLAAGWLLRTDQFLGVLAGENARRSIDVDPASLPRPGESLQVDPARYGLVVGCESPDGRPAYTITTPEVPLPPPTVPVAAYVDTIVEGLVELHGLTRADASAYLAGLGARAAT